MQHLDQGSDANASTQDGVVMKRETVSDSTGSVTKSFSGLYVRGRGSHPLRHPARRPEDQAPQRCRVSPIVPSYTAMELVVQILMLFIVVGTAVRLSFERVWVSLLFGLVAAAFVYLTYPLAIEQTKTGLAGYIADRSPEGVRCYLHFSGGGVTRRVQLLSP